MQNAECTSLRSKPNEMQNAKCKIMFANATAMMTATQSQLCFAYANRNYVPKGNANFTPLHYAHKEFWVLLVTRALPRSSSVLDRQNKPVDEQKRLP